MTQRIFDIDNEKDMADLWDILPDNAVCINFINKDIIHIGFKDDETLTTLFKINWHDKKEIKRPIQEATEQDLGKLCKFWDYEEFFYFGILNQIEIGGKEKLYRYRGGAFSHCRRLTKTEVSELC